MVWLHGRLELEIKEGMHLPGEKIGKFGNNAVGRLLEKGIAKINSAYVC